jgi:flavodoxin
MKIAVRYQSRGGNTKAVAQIIAQAFETEALTVKNPIEEYTEILFLGGGEYSRRMDNSLLRFIRQLPPDKVGKIISFSTAGFTDNALKQIRKEAAQKGIAVSKQELLVRMLLRGHTMLGLEGGKLSEKQRKKVHDFINGIGEI